MKAETETADLSGQKVDTSAHFLFSPRILDHLGVSAYNSLRKCLAELAANCYDADATKLSITIPDAVDENAVIEITDNGSGMSPDDIKRKFLVIGLNRRQGGQKTSNGRLVIGSKGIGKLAGFGIALTLQLVTRRDGTQSQIRIERHSLDDVDALSEHLLTIGSAPTELANGTTVRLMNVNPGLALPSADEVRRFLYRTLPKTPTFRVFVNDVECSVPGERTNFAEEIPGIGAVAGFYIVAESKQQPPGLAVKVRGRLVKEPGLFGLDTRAHGFFTVEKIIGEVNAEFLDPELPTTEQQDLINTARDGLLEDSAVVRALNDWARDFLRRVIQGVGLHPENSANLR